MPDNYIDLPVEGGTGVTSLNGQTGALTLIAGANVTITPGAGTLTISSAAPGTGTVTSVGLALPSIFSVSGSPVTTSGTLTGSFNTQSANFVFAGPALGAAATPTFRALVSADIPAINLATSGNGGVTGVLPIANGGTNSSVALNNNRIMVSSVGAIVEAAALTNGQVLIGSTGAAPVAANITAGSGVTVTNGAGSITVAVNNLVNQVTKTANYTILATDSIIYVDTTGGAFNLTLPDPTTVSTSSTTKIFRIVDISGTLSTNNLTLVRFGSEKIEGLAASKVFQTSWGGWQIMTNNVDWFVI